MQAVRFDLYETLGAHFGPDWIPPPLAIAQRPSVEEREFKDRWHRFDQSWQVGDISY